MKISIKRLERRDKSCMVPEPVPVEPGLFQIDSTCIHALLEAGFPAGKILYYRCGKHDWLTMGLPVAAGE